MTLISGIATEHTTLNDTDIFELERASASAKVTRKNLGVSILKSRNVITVASSTSRNKDYADYVCDGTADESEINSAIQALPTGGGVVELLEGEFTLATPIIIDEDNVYLRGQGPGIRKGAAIASTSIGTRLVAASGFTGSYMVLVQKAANDRTLHAVQLRDFTVDGNSIAGPIGGIHFRTHRGRMLNVFVEECTGIGLLVTGYSSWTTYDTMIAFCHFQNNDLDGMNFGSYASDLHVAHCVTATNGQDGLYVSSGGNQITGLHSYGNTRNGVRVGVTALLKLVNSKIENSRQHGVLLETSSGGISDFMMVGCDLRCNGRGGSTNQYNQLQIDHNVGNGIVRTVVSACQFLADGMDNTADKYKPGYNINVAGNTAQDTYFKGINYAPTHVQTGHISDAGQRTVIEGWSKNAGNPASAGVWNGQGREGIMVRDTSNNISYVYFQGGWIAL